MSESKGVMKPIFIGVATTVLATVIISYINGQKTDPAKDGGIAPKTLQSNVATTEVPTQQVDAGFERRKLATLRVWSRMQEIDAQSTLDNVTSATYQQIAYLYSQVDLSEADPLLVTHVSEAISLYREAMNLYGNYEAEVSQIQQAYMDDWQRQTAYQGVQVRYQPYFDNINQRSIEINNRDKTLARTLTEKYDVSFIDG